MKSFKRMNKYENVIFILLFYSKFVLYFEFQLLFKISLF